MKYETTRKLRNPLLAAAVAGLISGTATLSSCTGDGQAASKAERNGCSGPNGCGGKGDDKSKDTNGCSGPNGCNGHGTKGIEQKKG